jgi:hypothetical protein
MIMLQKLKKKIIKKIKRLERLKNTVNKYMTDIRPVSQNGSRRPSVIHLEK